MASSGSGRYFWDLVTSCVGTYLKVIRFIAPSDHDAFIVLYLRESKRFLFPGYWPGFERTFAAGTWARDGDSVRLYGGGIVSGDFCPSGRQLTLDCTFLLTREFHTPALTATKKADGWSLLSWTGPFWYAGEDTVINPDQRWMPDSMCAVDEWIGRGTRSLGY